MHAAKQIIIALVVLGFIALAGAIIIPALTLPHESGKIWYEPIDKLPEGNVAIILTEEDFAAHPAFSVIFDEENTTHSIPMVYDVNRKGNPEPHISEREGSVLRYEYPYVEYQGQLYEGFFVIA